MKKLKNLNLTNINKKITIILVILTLFTFITPNYVQAVDWESALTKPVKQLFAMIVDAILMGVQKGITDQEFKTAVNLKATGSATDTWDDVDKIRYLGGLILTPDSIFSNKILLLDPDFVNPIDMTKEGRATVKTAFQGLRQTIQNWYKGIRNLALVGLMSVLIYVGIRILMTSIAEDKAKYKKLLMYWVSGIALVFILNYIMAFTFFAAEELTKIFTASATSQPTITLPAGSGNITMDAGDIPNYNQALTKLNLTPGSFIDGSGKLLAIPTMQQYARLMTNSYGVGGFTYLIIYILLIAYTGFFFIVYLFRVLKIAFLTMIAPLICLTYPIDKISDGQAQAFNKWLKEFMYNVLIQPFHLLIYTIITGLAFGLADQVPIFSIVALAAILPIEKLMKEMFGFNKAPGVGAFSGAAAGSMVANSMQKLASKPGNKNPDSNKENSGNQGKENTSIKTNENNLGAYDLPEGENKNNSLNEGKEQNAEAKATAEAKADANSDNSPEKDDVQKQIEEHEQQAIDSREEAEEVKNDDYEAYMGLNKEADWHQSQADKLRQQQLLKDEEDKKKEDEDEEDEDKEAKPRLKDDNEEDEEDEDKDKEEKPRLKDDNEEDEEIKPNQKYSRLKKFGRTIGDWSAKKQKEFSRGTRAIGTQAKKGLQNKIGWQPSQYRGVGKGRGALNLAKNVGRVALKGAKGATKMGLRTAAAGGMAMVAGGAALITGNPKAILGATVAGGIAGSRLSKRAMDSTGRGYSSLKDTYDRGKLGEQYKATKAKAENAQWKNSNATDKLFRENFSNEKKISLPDGRTMTEKDAAIDFAGEIREKNGGNLSDDLLIKAVKMTEGFGTAQKGEELLTREEAKDIPAIAHNIKDEIYDDKSKYDDKRSQLVKQFTDKGVQGDLANRQADKILKDTAKFKGKSIPVKSSSDTKEQPKLEKGQGKTQNVKTSKGNDQSKTTKTDPPVREKTETKSKPVSSKSTEGPKKLGSNPETKI
jgi:hypothetical protein